MEMNPMNPFELTQTMIAGMREAEAAARDSLEKSRTACAVAEIAYAKCFTPVLFSLIADDVSLTRSSVHAALLKAGFTPSPTLANDIIQSGVMGGLIVIEQESKEGADAIYVSSARNTNVMSALYFAMM